MSAKQIFLAEYAMLIGLAPYAEEDGMLHRSNCGRDVLLTGVMLGLD